MVAIAQMSGVGPIKALQAAVEAGGSFRDVMDADIVESCAENGVD